MLIKGFNIIHGYGATAPAPPVPLLVIATSSPLTQATTGSAYSDTITATGGVTPYTWSITSDTPDTGSWLSINSSTGALSGTPGTAETESVTIKVIDHVGTTASKTFSLVVTSSSPPTISTSSPLPSATTGTAYSTALAATGGVTPYTWSITSDTPNTGNWLSINSTTGVLTGTPGTVETESVTVKVTDHVGNTGGKTFSLVVNSSGGVLVNFAAGLGREDAAMMIGYGANYTPAAANSPGTPPQDLSSFISDPSYCTIYCPNVCWGCFEQTQGTYDFTLVEYMYNQCASASKYLQLFIHGEAVPGVTSSDAFARQFLPAYLNDAGSTNLFGGLQTLYFGGVGPPTGGVVPMLGRSAQTNWLGNTHVGQPSVIEAFCNMCIALCNHTMTTGPNAGTQVKNLPYFLGITVWETAYNLSAGDALPQSVIDNSWGGNTDSSTGLPTGGDNLTNWYFNYANVVIPMLRNAIPNVCFLSRANWGTASYMVSIAEAGLTYKWAFSGGTDFTASPTDMDKVLNGTTGGVDYRSKLPIMLYNEDPGNGGGTEGLSSGTWPSDGSSTAAALVAACQLSSAWNACVVFPSRYTGETGTDDGWTQSTYAEWKSAYSAAGAHFAVLTPPPGFQAGPF